MTDVTLCRAGQRRQPSWVRCLFMFPHDAVCPNYVRWHYHRHILTIFRFGLRTSTRTPTSHACTLRTLCVYVGVCALSRWSVVYAHISGQNATRRRCVAPDDVIDGQAHSFRQPNGHRTRESCSMWCVSSCDGFFVVLLVMREKFASSVCVYFIIKVISRVIILNMCITNVGGNIFARIARNIFGVTFIDRCIREPNWP